ncbi:unnamed protein product [Prorocentrum cordatum]|uniref:Uncharacterized protein n=1 Tax=Prorocentrum cordatum TaxID=2364126 RepID=A0ABN9WCA9_9DINO|nr:unnamed protein product [Polarella glacialis]
MTLGSSFASHISLSSASARCHCSPFSHTTLGSSFASHISLSSASARCHCWPFSQALIPTL